MVVLSLPVIAIAPPILSKQAPERPRDAYRMLNAASCRSRSPRHLEHPMAHFTVDALCFISPQPLRATWLAPQRPSVSRRPRANSEVQPVIAVANPSSSTREGAKRGSSSPQSSQPSQSSQSPATRPPTAANSAGTGGALERETATDRYVDLRSLKKVGWHDVRVAAASAPGCRFGPFSCAAAVAALDSDVLFGSDTISLSPPQQSAVRALLSRRSVLYSSTLPGREALVMDLSARAREWGQTIVYCAPTPRAAEAMFVFMCSFAGGEKHVVLDVGHDCVGNTNEPPSRTCPSLVVTVPHILRRAIVDAQSYWWMTEADLYMLDDMLMSGVPEWEEIIIGMPSRALLCIMATDLTAYEMDELPLWLESVQNCIFPVRCRGSIRFSDRVDRPVDAPLARAFIYNPAHHLHPIQVSLPLVAEELRKELATAPGGRAGWDLSSARSRSGKKPRKRNVHPAMRNLDDVVSAEGAGQFANALLRGVKILSADNVAELVFDAESEAMFADVASLVVADARSGANKVAERKKRMRRRKTKVRKSAAVLQAAATRRRKREESELLPALVVMHGPGEAECAAKAVLSCLRDASVDLLYDEDAEELLSAIVDEFMKEHENMMPEKDLSFLSYLKRGVGVVHADVLPILRTLAEELFRDGLITVLCVDSYLGPRELAAMPHARSVLVQSSVLAEESDITKGILKGSLLGNLAGRPDLDDVGNIVALWFDEQVDDVDASAELAAALFNSEIGLGEPPLPGDEGKVGAKSIGSHLEFATDSSPSPASTPVNGFHARRRSGEFLLNYRGLLGALRRHGYEDYLNVVDYLLESYRTWMIGAGLRATREKVEVEKRAVDEHLTDVRWDELAAHDRLEASLNEQSRLLRAMAARKDIVLAERLLEDLTSSPPGTFVGMRPSREMLLSAANHAGDEPAPVKAVVDSTGGGSPEEIIGDGFEKNSQSSLKTVPAVLVSVLDQTMAKRQAAAVKGRALVVCITVDGMWTLIPVDDVVAIADKKAPVENVDLIPVPHLATFDLDPITKWAKCKPLSDSETLRVEAVAEELLGDLTTGSASVGKSFMDASSEGVDDLKPRTLPEYENQVARLSGAKKAYDASPWAGRDAEIADLRRLRSRAVGLGEEAQSLRSSEARLESSVRRRRGDFEGRVRGMLAVLEDCNAVSIPDTVWQAPATTTGEGLLDMTPIGSVASILPGPYPLFAAACLVLVPGLNEMSPAQLASFVAILVSDCSLGAFKSRSQRPESWTGDIFESMVANRQRDKDGEERKFRSLFPAQVFSEIEQIRSALWVVQRRHFEAEGGATRSPRIAPEKLDGRCASAIHSFVAGESSWEQVVRESRLETGDLVRDFRLCADALRVVSIESAGLGELVDLQETAKAAVEAINVWPVSDSVDLTRLAKCGISGQRPRGASYKSWWERAEADIKSAVEDAGSVSVPVAEVEVVHDGDDVSGDVGDENKETENE